MKVLLYSVLDKGPRTDALHRAIFKKGYNATILETAGLRHVIQEMKEPHATLSLSDIAETPSEYSGSTTMFIILEEEKLEELKELIRDYTKSFELIHGAMFAFPIPSYEGSF